MHTPVYFWITYLSIRQLYSFTHLACHLIPYLHIHIQIPTYTTGIANTYHTQLSFLPRPHIPISHHIHLACISLIHILDISYSLFFISYSIYIPLIFFLYSHATHIFHYHIHIYINRIHSTQHTIRH